MLKHRIIWLAVALRAGLYVFLHFSMGIAVSGSGLIGKRGGDTASYFDCIDNLLKYGHYTHIIGHLPAYAGRMPGYGIIYGLFRLVFQPLRAYDAVVLAQMALSLVSLYYLMKLTYTLTQRRRLAYSVVIVYAISPYGAQPDLFLLTESFAASSLIIGTYYCILGIATHSKRNLLIAGCWLAWLVFLRPYMAPLLGLWPVVYIYHTYRKQLLSWRKLWISSLLLVPFVIIDSAWAARNWMVYRQFIPLQTAYAGIPFPVDYLEARRFATALGEDPVEWNSSSLMSWLIRPTSSASPQPWQLTQQGTYDSLLWVRQRLQATQPRVQLPNNPHIVGDQQVAAALRRFHDAVVREKPFLYYIVSPLRLTYYLALTGGGTSIFAWPFSELSLWQKAMRLLFTCTHWVLVGVGLSTSLRWPRHAPANWLLVRLPPVFLILLFVAILRYVEARYFIVVYPLALLSGVVGITQLIEKVALRFLPRTNQYRL